MMKKIKRWFQVRKAVIGWFGWIALLMGLFNLWALGDYMGQGATNIWMYVIAVVAFLVTFNLFLDELILHVGVMLACQKVDLMKHAVVIGEVDNSKITGSDDMEV